MKKKTVEYPFKRAQPRWEKVTQSKQNPLLYITLQRK